MMLIIIKQSEKKHDTNQLHDAFIRAGFNPWPVESSGDESRFTFPDTIDRAKVQAVLDLYVFKVSTPQPTTSDIIQALAKMDLSRAVTLDDLKAQIAPVAEVAIKVVETQQP